MAGEQKKMPKINPKVAATCGVIFAVVVGYIAGNWLDVIMQL